MVKNMVSVATKMVHIESVLMILNFMYFTEDYGRLLRVNEDVAYFCAYYLIFLLHFLKGNKKVAVSNRIFSSFFYTITKRGENPRSGWNCHNSASS